MLDLARNGYSAAAVDAALHAPNRTLYFRYELYDVTGALKQSALSVLSASVKFAAFDEIKRTARFTVQDTNEINFMSDRIKPYARLKMPDGGFAEFPLGVFLLSTAPKKVDANGVITRELDGYDLSLILRDDKVTDRYAVASGTNVISGTNAVLSILNGVGMTVANVVASDKTLPTTLEWEPGTPKLTIVNDLLAAINYTPLWFDENGIPTAAPYVSPTNRSASYTYALDANSVTFREMTQSLDTFGVANQFVLIVSEADIPVLMRSVYTNSNPSSPTSTVSRGRTIVDYRTVMADSQATLDDMVKRVAFEASQVFESLTFDTAIMPFHSYYDVIHFTSNDLGADDDYAEFSWAFDLVAGAKMSHEVRRIVNV